jgi:peptidoglycan/xylan/chitin deacetylase (PgdA/CDA1 family)
MYHRVIEVASDPYELAVTPQHFEEQLEVLSKYARPISLQRLIATYSRNVSPRRLPGVETLADVCRGKRLPNRSVILTFDDGYADNLLNARPLLERYQTPATVFVTTGFIGNERESWWDELQRHLLEPGTLPETVCLDLPGEPLEWHLGEAADYTDLEYEAECHWNGSQPDLPGPRQALLMELVTRLRPLPWTDQRRVLDQLAAWTSKTSPRAEYRQMTGEELCQLADGGLVEIGAHTMTHPQLSAHSPEIQHEEIMASRAGLEEILGHSITNFAYPFGAAEHFNDDTVAILREGEFTSTVTTTPGLVERRSDRYRLPRHVVRDWDGDTFAQKLEEFFHG